MLVMRISGLVAVPLLLHILGVALYGVWAIASTLIVSQALLDLGAGAVAVRFLSLADRTNDGVAARYVALVTGGWYGLLGLLVGGAIVLSASGLTTAMKLSPTSQHTSKQLLYGAGIIFAVSNIVQAMSVCLQGLQRLTVVNNTAIAGRLVYTAALIVAALLNLGPLSVVYATAGLYLTQLPFLLVWLARYFPRGPSQGPRPTVSQMLRFGGKLQLGSAADFLSTQFPTLAAGFMLGAPAAARMDLALRIPAMAGGVSAPLLPPLMPAFARLQGAQGDETQLTQRFTLYSTATRYLGVILGMTFLVVFLCGQDLLELWVGKPGHGLIGPSLWAAVAMLALYVGGVSWTLVVGAGHADVAIATKLTTLIVQLAFGLALAHVFGLVGLAAGVALANLAGAAVLLIGVRSLLAKPDRWSSVRPLFEALRASGVVTVVGLAVEVTCRIADVGPQRVVDLWVTGVAFILAVILIVRTRAITREDLQRVSGRGSPQETPMSVSSLERS
jgi:O-antigen/teichoic acid export membrane protein